MKANIQNLKRIATFRLTGKLQRIRHTAIALMKAAEEAHVEIPKELYQGELTCLRRGTVEPDSLLWEPKQFPVTITLAWKGEQQALPSQVAGWVDKVFRHPELFLRAMEELDQAALALSDLERGMRVTLQPCFEQWHRILGLEQA